jgi:osmoprotectant transport system substrate-binding protein
MSSFRISSRRLMTVAAVLPLLALAACGGGGSKALSGGSTSAGGSAKGSVVIGGQAYTEMEIMSEIYAALLKNAGYSPTIKSVASRDVYAPSLEKGTVDVSADYASSMTEYLNEKANGADAKVLASPDINTTITELTKLGAAKGIEPLKPAGAQDANAFAVTKKFSDQNHVTTLSQLGALGQPIKLAAAPDCPTRMDCQLGLEKVYHLKISKFTKLGFGTPATKNALTKGEVTLGQVGTSDGSLAKLGLVVLADDKHLENAENLVPMVNSAWLKKNPDVATVLNQLSTVLTTDDLKKLNALVDVQRELPKDVAEQFLKDKGLLS